MQASDVSTPTVERISTIFVALELSQKSWLVTMHSPDRDRISRHKLAAGDHAGLLRLIESVRERAARALGRVPALVSCYEAGCDGFWLHRLLTAAGITNHVFDPASIAVEQRARRSKTDRIDGEQLLRTLMAYCRGEPRVVRIVRVPSVEQEDARRDTRERARLVKEQTAHSNRIKSLLRLLGMALGNPRRRDWLSWLAAQRDWQGEAVPPRIRAECTNCRTGLRPKEWPMCTRCYATTCTTVATEAIRASGQARDICHEVRELALAQWVGRIGRLSRYFATPRQSRTILR